MLLFKQIFGDETTFFIFSVTERFSHSEWYPREMLKAHPLLDISSTAQKNPENSPFGKVLRSKTFVDRTLLIKYVIEKVPSLLYITAPRKFGKTTNLHMLNSFFNPSLIPNPHQKPAGEKFHPSFSTPPSGRQLKITQEVAVVAEHMLQHPVIFLDFKKLLVTDVRSFKNSFNRVVLQPAYRAHDYLRNSTKLSADERNTVEKFLTSTVSESATIEGGRTLLHLLHKHFNKTVLVLIDNFDKPVQAMITDPVVSAVKIEMIVEYIHEFLSRLFRLELIIQINRDPPPLFSAVMTGSSELASILCPKLGVELVTFNEDEIAEYYTLSQAEVDTLGALFGATPNETESLQRWYGGYRVLDASPRVYGIYPIVSYFKRDKPGKFKPCWVRSGTLGILRSLFNYEYLGKRIHSCVSEGSTAFVRSSTLTLRDVMVMKEVFDAELLGDRRYGPDEFEKKIDGVLRFLLDEGYFTTLRQFTTLNRTSVMISIPNLEIRSELLSILYRAAYIKTEIERPTFLEIGTNITSALAAVNEANVDANLRWFLESITSLLDRSDLQPTDELEMAIILGSVLYLRDPDYKTVELFREKYEYLPQEYVDALMVVSGPGLNRIGYVMEMKFKWKSVAEALRETVSHRYSEVFQNEKFRGDFKEDVNVFVLVGLRCTVTECRLQYNYNCDDVNKRSQVITVVRRGDVVPKFDVQLDID
ncbi:unnamed protein product [Bemisia tabaci]|uniref:AAA-ATPase-like domain-containing protein n=1 Tax=Bemisia tabaci TaxID=7038 RepID=A0A9P0AIC7_BEMTA|nr:unnamed protein product [Bemisia tabaci]